MPAPRLPIFVRRHLPALLALAALALTAGLIVHGARCGMRSVSASCFSQEECEAKSRCESFVHPYLGAPGGRRGASYLFDVVSSSDPTLDDVQVHVHEDAGGARTTCLVIGRANDAWSCAAGGDLRAVSFPVAGAVTVDGVVHAWDLTGARLHARLVTASESALAGMPLLLHDEGGVVVL